MAFTFYHFGRGQYVGFNGNRKLKAMITRDEFGKRHLEIIDRALSQSLQSRTASIVFKTSAVSVQACKKRANEFLSNSLRANKGR